MKPNRWILLILSRKSAKVDEVIRLFLCAWILVLGIINLSILIHLCMHLIRKKGSSRAGIKNKKRKEEKRREENVDSITTADAPLG